MVKGYVMLVKNQKDGESYSQAHLLKVAASGESQTPIQTIKENNCSSKFSVCSLEKTLKNGCGH